MVGQRTLDPFTMVRVHARQLLNNHTMIIHIALFHWKKGIAKKDIQALMKDIKALKKEIPQIISIYAGKIFSQGSEGYTHGVVVTTKDEKGLDVYRNHKSHVLIVKRIRKMEAASTRFDFES